MSRNRMLVIGAVVAVLVLAGVVIAVRSSSSPSSSSAGGPTPTGTPIPSGGTVAPGTAGPSPSSEPGSPPSTEPGAEPGGPASADPGAGPRMPASTTTTSIPVNITVSNTSNITSGQPVTIRLTPTPGSQAFGFEAFLCRSGVQFLYDADIRPDETGKCASRPLAPGTEEYQIVQGQPPYDSVETVFRPGAGSDTFQDQNGRTVTITCGPGNPCQIVVKAQFPNGYGFRAFPVTYA